jgi:hypothetical protein
MARRQIPILVSSLITGAILIYFIGFWPGAILNTIVWGALIFLAKIYRGYRLSADPFQDDKYMLNFFLALIGRNR